MKNVKSDRDAAIEQLLRETLRPAGAAGPTGQCPNAETMAAWIDGSLSARERSAAEAAAGSARTHRMMVARRRTRRLSARLAFDLKA